MHASVSIFGSASLSDATRRWKTKGQAARALIYERRRSDNAWIFILPVVNSPLIATSKSNRKENCILLQEEQSDAPAARNFPRGVCARRVIYMCVICCFIVRCLSLFNQALHAHRAVGGVCVRIESEFDPALFCSESAEPVQPVCTFLARITAARDWKLVINWRLIATEKRN